MKLLNWMKYGKIINVIILFKLLKGFYISFLYCYLCFQTIIIYNDIHVSKHYQKYFSFNNIDIYIINITLDS